MLVKQGVKLDRIIIEKHIDDNPDTSWIGEYTDKWDDHNICCCCGEYLMDIDHPVPERGRNFRYFSPYGHGYKRDEEEYDRAAKHDFKRMEGLNRGDWCFIGINAKALTSYELQQNTHFIEDFSSGGLWGIESDSDEHYIIEVVEEQLDELKDHIDRFNVDLLNWDELRREAIEKFQEQM